MFLNKLQTAVFFGVVAVVIGIGALFTSKSRGAQPPPDAAQPDKPTEKDANDSEIRLGLSVEKIDTLLKTYPASDKMKKLLKDRYAAGLAELEHRWAEFLAGRGTLDIVCSCSKRLLRSEMAICTNKADRILALETNLQFAQAMERVNQARWDAGRIPTQDLKQTVYLALDAEIALEEAKAGKD
jgi:hypothetical protein